VKDAAVADATLPDVALPDASADAAPDAMPELTPLPAPPAPPAGDADRGWEYLRYGGYVGAGVPVDVFTQAIPPVEGNPLGREGDNATIPYVFTAFDETLEGKTMRVVGGVNCFACHASRLDGRFVPGLGNAFSDYTRAGQQAAQFRVVDALVKQRYGEDSPEYHAWFPLLRGAQVTAPASVTPFAGVNSAFLLEEAAAAWRDPTTLGWLDMPSWPVPGSPDAAPHSASDVPAWWLLKKKNAIYYNGMGRGDLTRMLMQISIVAVRDAAQAEEIRARFADVVAWIRALQPPPWPDAIDAALAARGRTVFEATCSRCHGTYGDDARYPNVLVAQASVGTDPLYAMQMIEPGQLPKWFDRSWYAGGGGAYAAPLPGYVAPPLDGVWATAPYLHNGSVPTLAALLDSSKRPAKWRRDFDDSTYDHDAVGWPYTVPDRADASTYDTTIPGYGNGGHTYGDALSADDRRAVIEYLKTL
jgi:mono/diheme cytochrome c family protein